MTIWRFYRKHAVDKLHPGVYIPKVFLTNGLIIIKCPPIERRKSKKLIPIELQHGTITVVSVQ